VTTIRKLNGYGLPKPYHIYSISISYRSSGKLSQNP